MVSLLRVPSSQRLPSQASLPFFYDDHRHRVELERNLDVAATIDGSADHYRLDEFHAVAVAEYGPFDAQPIFERNHERAALIRIGPGTAAIRAPPRFCGIRDLWL